MNEHIIFTSRDWINYIKDDGSIFVGCSREHFENINKKYDVKYRKGNSKDFEKFMKLHNKN